MGRKLRISILVAFGLVALASLPAPSETRASARFKVLHSFGSPGDGNNPNGAPALDSKGNLYGVTSGGPGEYGNGIVYELIPRAEGKWKEAMPHTFATKDGNPWGAPVFDASGDIYGTTVGGPVSNSEVFELSPRGENWGFTVLYANGAGPGLLIDEEGNLYGDMGPGAQKYYGAVAELSPGAHGWAYTALYSFCSQPNCADGYDPWAPPIWDGHGNMFGTTYYGGIGSNICWRGEDGCGVIYEMKPNGDGAWTYHVLHRFASSETDGQSPAAGLVMDGAGNFYGSTAAGGRYGRQDGGYGNGTVFQLAFTDGHWKKSELYDFPNCADGCNPGYAMVFDKAGNLYGTASGGLPDCGGYDCGVVYKLSPLKNGKWNYSVVHKLTAMDGEDPWGLTIDDKGNLYGTTFMFGKYNAGTAFEIIP